MRIGRIEIGITKYYTSNSPIGRYFEISYDKGLCGCRILNISVFYFTWMGDECYFNPAENEEI